MSENKCDTCQHRHTCPAAQGENIVQRSTITRGEPGKKKTYTYKVTLTRTVVDCEGYRNSLLDGIFDYEPDTD